MQAYHSEEIGWSWIGNEIIPGGYAYVILSCGVGVNKPLHQKIREQYMNWNVKVRDLGGAASVPAPDKNEITLWLKVEWKSISSDKWKELSFIFAEVVILEIDQLQIKNNLARENILQSPGIIKILIYRHLKWRPPILSILLQ